MPAVRYESAVRTRTADDGKTYDVVCACGFSSTGWAVKKHAQTRRQEHAAEHESGEPMRELVEFREALGLNGEQLRVVPLKDEVTG